MMQAGQNKAATSVNFLVFACNYCQKELKEKAVIKPTYFLTGDFELRTLHVCLFMVGSMFHCRQQWKPMHASTTNRSYWQPCPWRSRRHSARPPTPPSPPPLPHSFPPPSPSFPVSPAPPRPAAMTATRKPTSGAASAPVSPFPT